MSIPMFLYDTFFNYEIFHFDSHFILLPFIFQETFSEDLTNTVLPELSMEYWRIFFCCLFTCMLALLGKEHSNHNLFTSQLYLLFLY